MLVDICHMKDFGITLIDVILVDTYGVNPKLAVFASYSGREIRQGIIEVLLKFQVMAVECGFV